MARKIAIRYNIRLPPELRRKVCKTCCSYLVPGKSARVRTRPGNRTIVFTCLGCGRVSRFPYGRGRRSGSLL
jgi:ribonuclease P protein subunit RPR2